MMKKLTGSKAFLIVISILISFFMWIYVTANITDEITRTFSGIPVELVGETYLQESKDMTITDLSTNTVSVAISGPRRIVSGLSADRLTAQVDVSKLTQTAYATMQYTISYPDGTDTSSLSVTRKVPESLNFVVSKMVDKEIAVRGSFDGNAAEGYSASAPVFEPSTIIISGAENDINKISYAWVTFGAKDVTSTYSEDTTFTLRDYNDNDVSAEGITCSTNVIKATLPILTVKDVELAVDLNYSAGANEDNVTVTIEPESISVAGDSSILNTMNRLILDTIDLSSFESTYEKIYEIPLDESIENLSGVTEAKVKIEIDGLTTKSFKLTNIEAVNVTEGFKATIKTTSLNVLLRGTPEALSKISNNNLRAVADLTDYNETTGEQVVTVKIYVDGSADVGALGEYNVSILLERIQ